MNNINIMEIKLPNDNSKLTIVNDSIIYLCDRIENFDINLLKFVVIDNINFEVKIAYSYDNQNWSNPIDLSQLDNISYFNEIIKIDNTTIISIFVSIWLNKIETNPYGDTMYLTKNIDDTINRITISELTYNNKSVEYKVSIFQDLINQYPKWNLYDGQYINVRNWLNQCVSLAKSHGYVCIYFKTLPEEINHTIGATNTRSVVSVKRIMVQFPDNELPEDRNIYTEWDYALDGDAIVEINMKIFKLAFGEDAVPNMKDYFYLPILNKLFKITSTQPGKPFMGTSAWWNTYIAKWEDDETVKMSGDIMDAMSGFDDFDKIENMIEELELFKQENTLSTKELLESTIDEKKEATENFSNRLNDSTRYVDLKETEIQRQFFDKRLKIVSINPDSNAFPVTMYDCSTVTKRTVGLTYNLVDNVSVNRKSLMFEDIFKINFNYILQSKYSGEIFDLLDSNNLPLLTIESKRDKLQIINHYNQITTLVEYQFLPMEYYQFNLSYNRNIGQIAVSIFLLKNTQKKLEFQQVYINQPINNNKIKFSNIVLYGGNYFIGEVYFFLNNEKILSDFVNPILNMDKFGN